MVAKTIFANSVFSIHVCSCPWRFRLQQHIFSIKILWFTTEQSDWWRCTNSHSWQKQVSEDMFCCLSFCHGISILSYIWLPKGYWFVLAPYMFMSFFGDQKALQKGTNCILLHTPWFTDYCSHSYNFFNEYFLNSSYIGIFRA